MYVITRATRRIRPCLLYFFSCKAGSMWAEPLASRHFRDAGVHAVKNSSSAAGSTRPPGSRMTGRSHQLVRSTDSWPIKKSEKYVHQHLRYAETPERRRSNTIKCDGAELIIDCCLSSANASRVITSNGSRHSIRLVHWGPYEVAPRHTGDLHLVHGRASQVWHAFR